MVALTQDGKLILTVSLHRNQVGVLRRNGYEVTPTKKKNRFVVSKDSRAVSSEDVRELFQSLEKHHPPRKRWVPPCNRKGNRVKIGSLHEAPPKLKSPTEHFSSFNRFHNLQQAIEQLRKISQAELSTSWFETFSSSFRSPSPHTLEIIKQLRAVTNNGVYRNYMASKEAEQDFPAEQKAWLDSQQSLINSIQEYVVEPFELRLAILQFENDKDPRPNNPLPQLQGIIEALLEILKDPPNVSTQTIEDWKKFISSTLGAKFISRSEFKDEKMKSLALGFESIVESKTLPKGDFRDLRRYKAEAIYQTLRPYIVA